LLLAVVLVALLHTHLDQVLALVVEVLEDC
jgi:hypothetical protein